MTITSANVIGMHQMRQQLKAGMPARQVWVGQDLLDDCRLPSWPVLGECFRSDVLGSGFWMPWDIRKVTGWADG